MRSSRDDTSFLQFTGHIIRSNYKERVFLEQWRRSRKREVGKVLYFLDIKKIYRVSYRCYKWLGMVEQKCEELRYPQKRKTTIYLGDGF